MGRVIKKRRGTRATAARKTSPRRSAKPERWGRFTHSHKHTTGHEIGEYTIAYWRLGDVKLLPESCKREAEAKGYEFLGWAEP